MIILGAVLAATSLVASAPPDEKRPLKTETCVRESSYGDCRTHDYTYHFGGVSCLADCVSFDGFDQCRVRNACTLDKASGCFKRRVCVTLDAFGTCGEWKDEVDCD